MATATNPTVDELEKKEEELFRTGPLSVLTTSVKSNSQVWAKFLAFLPYFALQTQVSHTYRAIWWPRLLYFSHPNGTGISDHKVGQPVDSAPLFPCRS